MGKVQDEAKRLREANAQLTARASAAEDAVAAGTAEGESTLAALRLESEQLRKDGAAREKQSAELQCELEELRKAHESSKCVPWRRRVRVCMAVVARALAFAWCARYRVKWWRALGRAETARHAAEADEKLIALQEEEHAKLIAME